MVRAGFLPRWLLGLGVATLGSAAIAQTVFPTPTGALPTPTAVMTPTPTTALPTPTAVMTPTPTTALPTPTVVMTPTPTGVVTPTMVLTATPVAVPLVPGTGGPGGATPWLLLVALAALGGLLIWARRTPG